MTFFFVFPSLKTRAWPFGALDHLKDTFSIRMERERKLDLVHFDGKEKPKWFVTGKASAILRGTYLGCLAAHPKMFCTINSSTFPTLFVWSCPKLICKSISDVKCLASFPRSICSIPKSNINIINLFQIPFKLSTPQEAFVTRLWRACKVPRLYSASGPC